MSKRATPNPPPPPAEAGIARRTALAGLVPLLAVLPLAPPFSPAALAETPIESIRKAASVLPGYGPPDLIYPPCFAGRWRVTRSIAKLDMPQGEGAAPATALSRAREQEGAARSFEARYVGIVDQPGCIADRAFNAERRAAALAGAPLGAYSARWESSNPNVLTLTGAGGGVVETKVTKRSFESPSDGAFGTSEYARVADAGSAGVMEAVPLIRAVRVQVRYRWAPSDSVDVIEALELEQMFDPTATGFADLSGATPVLATKARLIMTRLS
jgi:hypothetical protein